MNEIKTNVIPYSIKYSSETTCVKTAKGQITIEHNHLPLSEISTKDPDKKELERVLKSVELCQQVLEQNLISAVASENLQAKTALKCQIKEDRMYKKILSKKLLNS